LMGETCSHTHKMFLWFFLEQGVIEPFEISGLFSLPEYRTIPYEINDLAVLHL
jgi:hypothetical protein